MGEVFQRVYSGSATRRKPAIVAVTSGERVLGVTALGEDVADAKGRAYEAVEAIHFENSYCRRDISDKAICVPG